MQAQAVLTEGLGEDFLQRVLEAEGVVVAVEKRKTGRRKEEGGGCYDGVECVFSQEVFLIVGVLYMYVPPQVSCVEGRRFCVQDGPGEGGVCGSSSGLRWGYFLLQFQKWGCF